MESKYFEAEISIKDIFFTIVKKIWIVIIVGTLLGCAFGGYKVLKRNKTYDVLDVNTKLNSSETDCQYLLRVQNINKARGYVDMISRVNSQIENQRDYISNSLYMQIYAENEFQTTAHFSLSFMNNISGADMIVFSAYDRGLRSGDYFDEYAKEINTKPEYIKELIFFNYSIPDNKLVSSDVQNNRMDSMTITVIGPSQEFCDDVMSLIIENIEQTHAELDSSYTQHRINILSIQHLTKIDESLRTGQNNQIARIDSLQKQIASYNDSLDKLARELGLSGKDEIIEYFESHSEVTITEIPTATSERYISRKTMLKPGIKYGAVGFILGAFVVVVCIVLKYLFGNKFSTQSHFFNEFYGIRKIGVMKPVGKRSKYNKFIDVITEDDSILNDDDVNKLIKFYLENLTINYNNVLITGVCAPDAFSSAISKLKLNGDCKPDIFRNPDLIEHLKNYDSVVLIEQRNVSLINHIHNEIEVLSNCGIDIIGAIII